MSRSYRKTPILGITTARSEAADKRTWHKRWRSRTRDQLAVLEPEGNPLPIHRHSVSSTWNMAKDGKSWFAPSQQKTVAVRISSRRTRLKPERKALQDRLLAKWRSK